MTSSIGGKAARKVLERHFAQYEPQDPYYEEYTDTKGRKKRRRREVPPGLSKKDAKLLKKIKRRAHYLDKGFNICGFRFGWTALIGLIPFVGDIADATLNYTLVVKLCKEVGIPDWLLRRLLFNNAVSIGVGLVPIVGDIGVAVFKTNSRNANLMEEFLRIRGEENIRQGVPGIHIPPGFKLPEQLEQEQREREGGHGEQAVVTTETQTPEVDDNGGSKATGSKKTK